MLTIRKAKFATAALFGAIVAASAAAPARAEGSWLWLESGSLFPVYRSATPVQPVRRPIQRARVARVDAAPVTTAAPVSGNFWASSRIYVAGLSF